MVAGAERIARRIEECEDSLTLVIVQLLPDHRAGGRAERDEPDHDLPRQSSKIEHIKTRSGDQQRRAEIRLALDQINGNHDQYECEHEISPADATLEFLKIPGKHQRQR